MWHREKGNTSRSLCDCRHYVFMKDHYPSVISPAALVLIVSAADYCNNLIKISLISNGIQNKVVPWVKPEKKMLLKINARGNLLTLDLHGGIPDLRIGCGGREALWRQSIWHNSWHMYISEVLMVLYVIWWSLISLEYAGRACKKKKKHVVCPLLRCQHHHIGELTFMQEVKC